MRKIYSAIKIPQRVHSIHYNLKFAKNLKSLKNAQTLPYQNINKSNRLHPICDLFIKYI